MMESKEGFRHDDQETELFSIDLIDAIGVGGHWHQVVPGSVTFSLDSEDTWWLSASLVPNLSVGDTPTHTVWFPSYEISGYRVADASTD